MFDKLIKVIGNTPFIQDDLKIAGYLLYKKLAANVIYKPSKKIKGPVTLIKATENFLHLEKDYGVSDVSNLFSLFFYRTLIFTFFLILLSFS